MKFAHQLLCNPKISTLLKAVHKGCLKGCLNLSKKLILKYLNPSPATAKGCMTRPRYGICITCLKLIAPQFPVLAIAIVQPIQKIVSPSQCLVSPQPMHHIINNNMDESIANLFFISAFANSNLGVVYHNFTRNFPFMSYNGSVCLLVAYNYEANAIIALPIARLDDITIFNAFKATFDKLTVKGFKPKLNVMNNQATKNIKKISHQRKLQNATSQAT
jgi:hypothetical protein